MENGQEPASKQDVEQLRQDVKQLGQDVEQLRQDLRQNVEQLRSESNHGFDELKETMRDVQTEILKAFYGYTQTTDAKLREGEQSDGEKRLNMPPQVQ